ncbi:MAG: YCF48-related protein [Pseudomonadota bacterium]
MKRHPPYTSAGLLLALLLAAACHPTGGDGDRSRGTVIDRLTQRDRLYDVAFVGGEVWAVGFPGLILHSPDGGATWEAQDAGAGGTEALFDVDMLDASTGWIAGRNGLVLHTADGGATWSAQKTPTDKRLFAVAFLDAQEGWAVGEFATVLKTTDGGGTWALVPATLAADTQAVGGPSTGRNRGVDAPPTDEGEDEDEDEGGDDFGGAPDTDYGVDGGDANEDVNLAGDSGRTAVFDRHLGGVHVLGPGSVLAAGESGVILRTDDGGATWRKLNSGEWATLYGIGLPAGPEGPAFVVGSSGVVRRSTDGGVTWDKVETGTEEHLFRFAASVGRLFVVGRRGLLLAGALDANALTPVPLGIWGWISGIAFGPDGAGVLVGGQGLVMTTTDGGVSWRRAGSR